MIQLVKMALAPPYTVVVMGMLILIFGVNGGGAHAGRHQTAKEPQ